MVAISQSQSHRDESRQSSVKSTVSSTWEHSPESEELHKQPNIWDLKDLAHPLYRHGTQKAYKHWLNKAREEANNSPKCLSPTTSPYSPSLEDIPEEDIPPEETSPIVGPSTMPEEF
jgi:hypothetical protein